MIEFIALLVVGLSAAAEGLKCFVRFNGDSKLAQDTLDAYEFPIDGQQCVFAECIDKFGKNSIWPTFVDCKEPEVVNCTQLANECGSQEGNACCFMCKTDNCNREWNCGPKPTTVTAMTTTESSTAPTTKEITKVSTKKTADDSTTANYVPPETNSAESEMPSDDNTTMEEQMRTATDQSTKDRCANTLLISLFVFMIVIF